LWGGLQPAADFKPPADRLNDADQEASEAAAGRGAAPQSSFSLSLLFAMRQPIAGVSRAHNLHRVAARFNKLDAPVVANDKRHPIRNGIFRDKDAVFLRDVAIQKITEQREREIEAGGERFE